MIFYKDPDAVLDYYINWQQWLSGDEIATSQWTVPTGITKASELNTVTKATVWLSGGTAGTSYVITNRITTKGGRTDDRSLTIQVKQR